MSKSKFYVGVDVGKDTLVAAKAESRPRSFANNRREIGALVAWAKKAAGETTVHICMESTGVYGVHVAMQMIDETALEVSLVNPAQIAAFAKAQLRRSKTDSVDAQVILAFARSQQPRRWQPERMAVRQLYALVTELDMLNDTTRRLANRDHSQGYVADLPKEVQKAQNTIGRSLTRQCSNLEQAIAQLVNQDNQLSAEVNLLSTIPGVKQNTAVHVLAYGKSHLMTHSRKELTAHAGLAPRQHQSGSSIRGKSRIAKQGDKRLRKALYMSTLCGIVHNPLLKTHYQRLLAQGKPKKLALTACMRKLLLIMQAIIKTNKPFNPSIQPLT